MRDSHSQLACRYFDELAQPKDLRLRERFTARMGRDAFRKTLLEGGELSFHLAAGRLKTLSRPLQDDHGS
jgi:hypothetical protein